MPKLWDETIEAHRHAVADSIMNHTAELAATEGLHSLSMARIAQTTGIGRATLYKYFGDVEQILTAWHQRQVTHHLQSLQEARAEAKDPLAALENVLLTYARNRQHGHGQALAAFLHTLPHVGSAHVELQTIVAELIRSAVAARLLNTDTPTEELARYALAALTAQTPSRASLSRLVKTILRGLGAA